MKTIGILLISAVLLVSCSSGNAQDNLTVQELNKVQFKSDDNKVLLDVRTSEEYRQGHIKGSENLDVLKTDLFTTSIANLDKNKTYYVICRSGGRSQRAKNQMEAAGFKNVINITGGMQAWEVEKLPVENE